MNGAGANGVNLLLPGGNDLLQGVYETGGPAARITMRCLALLHLVQHWDGGGENNVFLGLLLLHGEERCPAHVYETWRGPAHGLIDCYKLGSFYVLTGFPLTLKGFGNNATTFSGTSLVCVDHLVDRERLAAGCKGNIPLDSFIRIFEMHGEHQVDAFTWEDLFGSGA